MADSPSQILESISALVANKDAAALVLLEGHADKKVRKAARKAIHKLRSRGVEIPDADKARTWIQASSDELRNNNLGAAIVDMDSTPGATRFMIAEPAPEERGHLLLATVTGDDMVLDFGAYVQTDGQRGRLIRDWGRSLSERSAPLDWAKARIRWAREQNLARGQAAPRDLNESLELLGDVPSERPASFLGEKLDGVTARERGESIEPLLQVAGVTRWPPVIDVESILAKVQESQPDINTETPESERLGALIEGARGQVEIREALQGRVANLLEDAAIGLWLKNQDADAKAVHELAVELRGSAEPEVLDWVGRFYGLQVFATLTVMAQQQGMSTEQFTSQLQAQAQAEQAAAT